MMMRLSFCLAVSIAACGIANAQSASPHPADLIKQPGYNASWAGLMNGQRFVRRDSWITKLIGPGSATNFRDSSGMEWIEGNVCQPHNCGDNHMIVLFDPKTKRIWAAQRTRGDLPKSERFFGDSDSAMRKLLSERIVANFP